MLLFGSRSFASFVPSAFICCSQMVSRNERKRRTRAEMDEHHPKFVANTFRPTKKDRDATGASCPAEPPLENDPFMCIVHTCWLSWRRAPTCWLSYCLAQTCWLSWGLAPTSWLSLRVVLTCWLSWRLAATCSTHPPLSLFSYVSRPGG